MAVDVERTDPVARWADSGAMGLTGPADGRPLGPPAPLVAGLDEVALAIATGAARVGRAVTVDPLGLICERAALGALVRNGTTSCGGATRLVRAADGWFALSLARPDDIDLLPAWLGRDLGLREDPWDLVAEATHRSSTADVVARGATLGLPVAAVGERPAPAAQDTGRFGVGHWPCGPRPPVDDLTELVVVDLSSLWAGPLCGSLLHAAGAEVWKVESTARPDGARSGIHGFHDLLNGGKASVALDLRSDRGRRQLHDIVAGADVVIEASRPRALEQLGLDARAIVSTRRPKVWISITAHGRGDRVRERVGFGDDAAAAGGLVAWSGPTPNFCVDAIADPITGMVAAAAGLEALASEGSWLLDVPMATVAAHFAGPTLDVPGAVVDKPPTARPIGARAHPLGQDTAAILDRIGTPR